MPRYAAFLRGVMPTNATMPGLKKAFEAAGFTDVRTLLSSGNVVFSARAAAVPALQRKAEAAMTKTLGREFLTIIRSVDELQALIASDPFAAFRLKPGCKRIITFLRETPKTPPPVTFPVTLREARILGMKGGEVFTVYLPDAKGPDFMKLIEQTFGKDVTTRTWDTVARAAR